MLTTPNLYSFGGGKIKKINCMNNHKEPREFSDMGDAPTNTGYSERDWDEIRTASRYPDDEEDLEIDYEAGFDGEVVTVENNNGQFNCQNDV